MSWHLPVKKLVLAEQTGKQTKNNKNEHAACRIGNQIIWGYRIEIV
ncbi:hypothetical protein [Paenibacillus amylolyticus]